MIMEYVDKGSLKGYISTNKEHVKDDCLLRFALDIAMVGRFLMYFSFDD